MEIVTDDQSESKFPLKKPLPPIGAGGDHVASSEDDSESEEEVTINEAGNEVDDDRSTVSNTSSTVKEKQGQGKSRPSVLRGYRRESADKEEEELSSGRRSVGFSPASATGSITGKSKTPASKETMKRQTYDGREVTFITEDTQTDWEWLEDAEQLENVKIMVARDRRIKSPRKRVKGSRTPRSTISRGSIPEEEGPISTSAQGKGEDAQGQKPDVAAPEEDKKKAEPVYPFNDEFGVPMLELSSDSDTSSDEEDYGSKRVQDDRTFMPSIGPPQILQYVRESERKDIEVEDPEGLGNRSDEENADMFPVDEQGRPLGMFGGTCEFCGHEIQPWPTVAQQQTLPPDQLYCCNQYREFVEFTVNATEKIEEEHKKKNKKININTHPHYGSSKEDRKVAKERALQRMREKEMQRKQQEASGFQQSNFYSSRGVKGGMNLQQTLFKEMAPKSVRRKTAVSSSSSQSQRSKFAIADTIVEPLMLGESTTGFGVAQKMKTINYQLSSQKCLEEGWTIRAPSPLLPEDEDDTWIPEPINIDLIRSGKLGLVEKFYDDGQKFLTMFPDGTGNLFYPSGNLAINVSSIELGHFTYVIHADSEKSQVLAVFEPSGYACCYHTNGVVRLYMDQLGGTELDVFGAKKRRWNWKDMTTHVHAPPFQPIYFGLNRNLGVKIMAQDKMAVVFSAKDRGKRFNVGARLKLNHVENIPPPEIDDSLLFLDEKKVQVETLLDKVSTLLKFPKSPKIDKILPPLHLTTKALKTERLKTERTKQIAAQEAKKLKQPAIVVT